MDMGWRLLMGGLTATIALLGASAAPRRAVGGPAPFAVLREFTIARTAGIVASPAISGRTVVWVQTQGPLQPESVYPRLYGADLATRRVFRLPVPGQVVSPPLNPPSPAIDGNLVVWIA